VCLQEIEGVLNCLCSMWTWTDRRWVDSARRFFKT